MKDRIIMGVLGLIAVLSTCGVVVLDRQTASYNALTARWDAVR